MHDLLPEGEELRRAVKWVSANLQEKEPRPLRELVAEAVFRFDLSPRDGEFLLRFFELA